MRLETLVTHKIFLWVVKQSLKEKLFADCYLYKLEKAKSKNIVPLAPTIFIKSCEEEAPQKRKQKKLLKLHATADISHMVETSNVFISVKRVDLRGLTYNLDTIFMKNARIKNLETFPCQYSISVENRCCLIVGCYIWIWVNNYQFVGLSLVN